MAASIYRPTKKKNNNTYGVGQGVISIQSCFHQNVRVRGEVIVIQHGDITREDGLVDRGPRMSVERAERGTLFLFRRYQEGIVRQILVEEVHLFLGHLFISKNQPQKLLIGLLFHAGQRECLKKIQTRFGKVRQLSLMLHKT